MTRGRELNRAYVAVDRPDALHSGPHPADPVDATGRSVLAGVLQHVGAELSARESLVVEQEAWGTIAQLAAEYETIAAAAQRDRWVAQVRASGLGMDQVSAVVASDALGPLNAELRRAEAYRHDVDAPLPRLVRARGFDDADDIAAVLRNRVTAATARPARAGRGGVALRSVAGLIPEAGGEMSNEMRQALEERRELIEARADAVFDAALADGALWVAGLGTVPSDPRSAAAWRDSARVVAAYRDRYKVTADTPLGLLPDNTIQGADYARAEAALRVAKAGVRTQRPEAARAAASSPARGL